MTYLHEVCLNRHVVKEQPGLSTPSITLLHTDVYAISSIWPHHLESIDKCGNAMGNIQALAYESHNHELLQSKSTLVRFLEIITRTRFGDARFNTTARKHLHTYIVILQTAVSSLRNVGRVDNDIPLTAQITGRHISCIERAALW